MSTYVLIHGGGDVGWSWHLVAAELSKELLARLAFVRLITAVVSGILMATLAARTVLPD